MSRELPQKIWPVWFGLVELFDKKVLNPNIYLVIDFNFGFLIYIIF